MSDLSQEKRKQNTPKKENFIICLHSMHNNSKCIPFFVLHFEHFEHANFTKDTNCELGLCGIWTIDVDMGTVVLITNYIYIFSFNTEMSHFVFMYTKNEDVILVL